MTMTKRQVVVALLAGSAVVVGSLTLQFTGVQAADRLTVQSAYENHDSLRYVRTTSADGGALTRDLLQEYSDACTAAQRKVRVAQEEHIVAGTKTAGEVKGLRTAETAACSAYGTLAESIATAQAVYEGADIAYACEYLEGDCPDGGS